jgi:hypothetical protein
MRKEIKRIFGTLNDGQQLTFSRKGITIEAWFDSGLVGMENGFITWDEVLAIKAKLDEVTKGCAK